MHSNRDGEQFRADLESCPLGGGQRYLEPNALIDGHEVEHRAHIETPLIGRHQQRGAISGGSERTQESGMPRTDIQHLSVPHILRASHFPHLGNPSMDGMTRQQTAQLLRDLGCAEGRNDEAMPCDGLFRPLDVARKAIEVCRLDRILRKLLVRGMRAGRQRRSQQHRQSGRDPNLDGEREAQAYAHA